MRVSKFFVYFDQCSFIAEVSEIKILRFLVKAGQNGVF